MYSEVCFPLSGIHANKSGISSVQPSDIPGPLVNELPLYGEPSDNRLSTPPDANAVVSPNPVDLLRSMICATKYDLRLLSS